MRQFLCSILALAASVGLFLLLKDKIGTEYASWLCIAAAAPLATCGFFQYNNLTLEKFILAYLKSEWIVPKKRYFASENFHYKLIFTEEKGKKESQKKTRHPKRQPIKE